MARSAEDIIKFQIGDMFVQLSVLAATNEALKEELAKRPPAPASDPAPAAEG